MSLRAGLRRRALLLLAAVGAASAGAQPVEVTPAAVCRLPVAAPGRLDTSPGPTRRSPRAACDAPRARFEVDYAGFPADARAAFQAAVDTWACRVASPVAIRVSARWQALGPTTLGSAGPYLVRDFDRAPVGDTWYPTALANAIAGRDLDPARPEIDAAFNSRSVRWHTDPDTPPPADAYDLYTIVLHEIGHGLGLIGGLAVREGRGVVGDPQATPGAYLYDRFTSDAAGRSLLVAPYADGSALLAEALQSRTVFDGRAVSQAVGAPAALYAPPVWVDGASYSHLDEADYPADTPEGLMTPFLGRGEAIGAPGPTACAMLADLGWTLAGACAEAVGDLLPVPPDGLAVRRTGANPFRGETRVEIDVSVPQRVLVHLVDALGRVVDVLADATVTPASPLSVTVDGRRLAAGAYRVAVRSASGARAVSLAVVR